MAKIRNTKPKPAPVKSLPPAGATADEPPFHKGDRVQHPQFGKGKVMSVEADKVTIAFDKPAGTKVVIESYVKPG